MKALDLQFIKAKFPSKEKHFGKLVESIARWNEFPVGEEEVATFALETFFLIFFVTAIALTIIAVMFVFKTTKLKSKKELQEKRMGIIDQHFNEMTRVECPYCKTLYSVNRQECPNCRASTKKILFPEIPG